MTETNQELAFIEVYMKDAENVSSLTEDERCDLIVRLSEGDSEVSEDLINSMLLYVAEAAQKYRDKGVHFGDLVQDANMALMDVISEYDVSPDDFYDIVDEAITESFENSIEEYQKVAKASQQLADKLNKLDDITKKLTAKLDRLPTTKELSKEMGCSESEIEYLLKASLDAMTVGEDSHIMDDLSGIDDTFKVDDEPLDLDIKDDDPLDWNF